MSEPVKPALVSLDRTVVRQLVTLARSAHTEHRYIEVKIRDGCAFEPCEQADHANCAVWGSSHDPADCPACVPILAALHALGEPS